MYPFLFENGGFSFRLATRIRSKRSPKTHLFKNALQSEDFWKPWPLLHVWTDENGDFLIQWCTEYIIYYYHSACSVQRFHMDGRKRFEYATCRREFFCKTEEKISVSKVSGCVWPRLKMAFSEIFVGAHHLTYREATCRMCGVKLGEVFCSLLSCRNWNWKPV